MKLLVSIWMDSIIAFFTKVQSGLLHEAHLPWFPLPIQWLIALYRTSSLHNWLPTTFLQWGSYSLLIFEDIYKMYQQYFAEIPVNPTCVFPQSAPVDGTADMHCLLIDPNKNGKLATTISCYHDLSCKGWCFDWSDQLLPYLYYIEKYFEAGQSQPCLFELWQTMSFLEGHYSNKCRRYCYHLVALPSNKR